MEKELYLINNSHRVKYIFYYYHFYSL